MPNSPQHNPQLTSRPATFSDHTAIAALHAQSWQQNYRGSLSDHYLDHEAAEDRLTVWRQRLSEPRSGQLVNLILDGEELTGFVCTFVDYDDRGSYLDNLHIDHRYQGRGLGARLMSLAATQVIEHSPDSALYLWVLEKNEGAKRFYERLGATCHGPELLKLPSGGGSAYAYRMHWADPRVLIQ